jgi:lipoprotein-anchoring transpeptidase ErfK/SrfK
LATTPSRDGISEKWIDVGLTNQRLRAYEGNVLVFEAAVSRGLTNTPSVRGKLNIYWKLVGSDMAGRRYYLVGVGYTMYCYRGYALHGTYWHTNFGQPMSHGCINLRTEDGKWLFDWADPSLPAGGSEVRSSDANAGMLVVIHH